MSTLFGDSGSTPADGPVRSRDDLLEIFRRGIKPPEQAGVGIEYERLPVCRETGLVVPYTAHPDDENPASIEAFLEALVANHGWTPQRENGHIMALERGKTRITLEPGAQIELSGRVHRGLDSARDELCEFVREVDVVADGLGIAFLPLGYHPFSAIADIDWVPKKRYGIMAPYLAKRGHHAHSMMKATAGCQINLDYDSEEDAMEKFRVAMGVSTLVTGLCANSPLTRGQANGFVSFRAHIWMHTDPDRCGLLRFALERDRTFSDYIDYALDVPMFFVIRDGEWIEMTDVTFRQFLDTGHRGLVATRTDWELHLTTLFPEARVKSWIEVRGSDSGPPSMIMAQAALWKGILYDAGARKAAWALVADGTWEERIIFHNDLIRTGLKAHFRGRTALDLARELINIADAGLPDDESKHLEPFREITATANATPGEQVLKKWNDEWAHEPGRLVEALAPAPETLHA